MMSEEMEHTFARYPTRTSCEDVDGDMDVTAVVARARSHVVDE